MNKEDISSVLEQHNSTILSFPDRGPWGDSRYRGNCSGWVHAFLIWKYNVMKMAELFAGSGTGSDVCKDMCVPYTWTDVVYAVVQTQEICSLAYIYSKLENNKKAKKNPHWKEKIRQVLGQHPLLFHQYRRGEWSAITPAA